MNFTFRAVTAVAAACAALSLAACGGGDSGTEITYSPSQVTATGAQQANQQVRVDATVANPPSTSVYVEITADKPVIIAQQTSVAPESDGRYVALIAIDTTQPVGTYTGNFTLALCTDPACMNKLPISSGATLPYSITIVPTALSGVTMNGSALDPNPSGPYQGLRSAHPGDVVSITTNATTTWSVPQAAAGYTLVSSTPTSATVRMGSGGLTRVTYKTTGGYASVDFMVAR